MPAQRITVAETPLFLRQAGARVIYFYHDGNRPLYLLLVYAKARREDLSPAEKLTVRKLAAMLKR